MKRLWKHIPPCLSDVMGFQAVMTQTDGLGIVDDSGRYKPLSILGVEDAVPMSLSVGSGKREEFKGFMGRPGAHNKKNGPANFTDSALRNEDIIRGTERKMVNAFKENAGPETRFVLISNAPSSAMISSDTESAAISIAGQSNIPAGCVKIYGEKDYLFGMSETFLAMAKLLVKKNEKLQGSVNIIGCGIVDWNEEAVNELTQCLTDMGISVLSRWGAKNFRCEDIKNASKASLNIAVSISAIKVCRYMEDEFEIPYIAAAPFGRTRLEELLKMIGDIIQNKASDIDDKSFIDKDKEEAPPQALVVGEQLTANAIRKILLASGYKNVKVASFYEMDRAYMEPGDRKMTGEDDFMELASEESLTLIAANPDYKGAVKREIEWISLPNSGMSMLSKVDRVNMVGEKLDRWLNERLR